MPEGPEVKLNVALISELFNNTILKDIKIHSGRYIHHKLPKNYEKFRKELPLKFKEINNYGKFVYFKFEKSGYIIGLTFGMTGFLTLEKDDHSHIEFICDSKKSNFYFDDMRNFGTITFYENESEFNKKFLELGPDPLIKTFEGFEKNLPKKMICLVLMDPKYISGIGNYLRAEILYDAEIDPFKLANKLGENEIKRLIKSINKIMMESYLSQIKNGLHEYEFKIYGREETDKGEKVLSKKINGRTIWYIKK